MGTDLPRKQRLITRCLSLGSHFHDAMMHAAAVCFACALPSLIKHKAEAKPCHQPSWLIAENPIGHEVTEAASGGYESRKCASRGMGRQCTESRRRNRPQKEKYALSSRAPCSCSSESRWVSRSRRGGRARELRGRWQLLRARGFCGHSRRGCLREAGRTV